MLLERKGSSRIHHGTVSPNDTPLFPQQPKHVVLRRTTETNQSPVATPAIPDFVLADTAEVLAEALQPLLPAPVLGIDTETTGLNPHCHQLRLIQIAAPNHPVVLVDLFKIPLKLEMWDSLRRLFQSSAVKVFHNAKFDLKFLTKLGLRLKNPPFDTQIAHQLLTAGLHQKSSLQAIARQYLKLEIEKESQLSDWSAKQLSTEQLKYAALDAHLLLRLREVLKPALIKAELAQVARIEFSAIPAVAEMEWHGMLLDVTQWTTLVRNMEVNHQRAAQNLQQMLQSDNPQLALLPEANAVNLDSPSQVFKSLQAQGIPIKSTNKKEIAPLVGKYPVLQALLEYRKHSKSLSAFGKALLTHISPHTGRIHPEIWQLGAVSGRFSFSKPNLQQVPRGVEVRKCFVPAPGKKLIIADYSQIELRIAAEISGDETMIQAYQNGQDLHRLTASLVMGKSLDSVGKSDRQVAKPINFGLIYGMGAPGLQNYASVNYGVQMSFADAKRFRFKFFDSYTGLAAWHGQVRKALYDQKQHETRTLANRRRRWLPSTQPSLNKMLNLPVQGTSADITKLALANLKAPLEHTAATIIAVVHDEIILECPELTATQAASILKTVMIQAGETFLQRVPVEVEVTIADNWAEK